MAIAFDTAGSSSTISGSPSVMTISLTLAGADRMLIAGASAVSGTLSVRTVASITWNGVALTKIAHADNAVNCRAEMWRLIAPDTGTHDLVITWGGAVAAGRGGAVSLTGVAQSAPEASNTATGSGTAVSVSVTTVADNAWVVDVAGSPGASNTLTVGAGQTERWNQDGAGAGAPAASSTEGPKTPAGAVSMDWTLSITAAWCIVAASFAPSAAADRLGANFYQLGQGPLQLGGRVG